MGTTTTSASLFSPQLTTEMFNKVKGHSSLAKLSESEPVPFAGTDVFVFSMDGEASIVGEGGNKPAGDAAFSKVTIQPIKFIYQHRVTDEFINLSAEAQVPYLQAFADGFAKKIARALDIAAFHGIDPASKATSTIIGANNFDSAITTNVITYNASTPDDNLQAAVSAVVDNDCEVSGIVMSPAFAAAMGNVKAINITSTTTTTTTDADDVTEDVTTDVTTTGNYLYPEFRFGAKPASFNGMGVDVNGTLSYNSSNDRALVGDFANAFRWGYSKNIPMKIIEFGDPDGQGDLQRMNQVCLRAEAYIGWGILDSKSFAHIKVASTPAT